MAGGIPDHVRRFVAEHVFSVEQLEVLLLLQRDRERAWTPEAIAGELYTQPESSGRWLEYLVGRGLAARGEGDAYRFDPPDDRTARTIGDLAEQYARRRVSMIQLIFADRAAPGPDPVQSFADAFRIRDEDEGKEG